MISQSRRESRMDSFQNNILPIFEALHHDNLESLKRYIQASENQKELYPTWICLPLEHDTVPEILGARPPLISIATYYGSMKCIQFLLNHGAELSDTDDFGFF